MTTAKLSVGAVLARAARAWRRNFVTFTLLALLAHSPALYLGWSDLSGRDQGPAGPASMLQVFLLVGLLGFLSTCFIAHGVVQDLRGKRATFMACLSAGGNRLGSLVTALLAMAFTFALTMMAVGLPFGVIRLATGSGDPGSPLMWVSAVVYYVAIGFLYTRYYLVVPVAVMEHPGAFASLARSTALGQEQRWRVFALVLLVFLIDLGTFWLTALFALLGRHAWLLSYEVAAVLVSVLGSCVVTVAYHDLRELKEGVSVDDLETVFE